MATRWRVHPGGFHHLKSILRVGCWNVRSLVEADGGVKTATVRAGPGSVVVDKKVRFLVRELMCFRMGVTCISETRWFGKDVYEKKLKGILCCTLVVISLDWVMLCSVVKVLPLFWIL